MKRAYLLIFLLAACQRHERAAAPADIILITIDTLRADSVGYAGNANVKTPFLDRIASEGIVFQNAHAHNVVTLPSHTNILTGLYPYQHGVRDNSGFKLDPKHETVATMLRRAGWTTGAFIGAFPLDARFGLNQGFDTYDDNYGKGEATVDFVIQERSATAVLDSATRWWQANQGKKRFMWIHLYDPHAPYRPPEPFATQYARKPYLGEIAYVDDALGKAIPPMLGPSTLMIITADHGEALGDHGELTHGLFAYESTLHIPLLVWQPGIQHRIETAYVRHIDIVPTILAAVGLTKPRLLLGESLLDVHGSRDGYFESLSASLNRGWAPLTGVIHHEEKFIDLPITELYDLPHDPGEVKNLVDERRRDAQQAREVLANFHANIDVANRNVTPEEAARLRSLGYVTGSSTQKTYTTADDPKNLVAVDQKLHDVIDAYERHDVKRAIAIGREVVAMRPGMAAGYELLAFALQQDEQVGKAIATLRKAIQTGGATQSSRVQLGLLLTETGHANEAVPILAAVAKSEDPDALNAYGIALADEGKFDEANAQFQRVLQLDANNAPALQNLGIVALRRDDVPAAGQDLTRALALNPRLPLALNAMGVVSARQNDFPKAVEYWNRAVAIDPHQYDALLNIGRVEGHAGHTAEARAALERFVRTAPKERYAAEIEAARQALTALP